ncbi:MAG: type II secretion system F family protein [Opitutaceae bacterium]|nr:type II secretion system F family protein [Opitutaceae bacterium]
MPTYAYEAIAAGGTSRRGTMEAADERRVVAELRRAGLYATAVKPAARQERAAVRWRPGRPVAGREVAVFTRQLATLLRAGMPLVRGLEVLARQERNPRMRALLGELAEAIRAGSSLSEAMARRPRVFGSLLVSLVKAGEAGGALELVLDRAARLQEKALQLRGRLRAAAVYPLAVLLVAGVIVAGLLGFVVPKFEQIFADLLKGAPLPPLTQAVLGLGSLVRDHLAALAAATVGGLALLTGGARSRRGAAWLDAGLIRMPVTGEWWLKAVLTRAGRTLGTLLAGGVPLLSALEIAEGVCGNRRIAAAVAAVREEVVLGSALAAALDRRGVFPPLFVSMVEVGEQTGALPEMLAKLADIYEEELDAAVAGLSSLLEPALIVFLAVVVGTLVVALFLPIVRIVQLMT